MSTLNEVLAKRLCAMQGRPESEWHDFKGDAANLLGTVLDDFEEEFGPESATDLRESAKPQLS